jgi:hypothetical protein
MQQPLDMGFPDTEVEIEVALPVSRSRAGRVGGDRERRLRQTMSYIDTIIKSLLAVS